MRVDLGRRREPEHRRRRPRASRGDCDDLDPQIGDTSWHDLDGDGFGDDTDARPDCLPPLDPEWSYRRGDCDDARATVNPDTFWYVDADTDGDGDPASAPQQQCANPGQRAPNALDCDDLDPTVNSRSIWYEGTTMETASVARSS